MAPHKPKPSPTPEVRSNPARVAKSKSSTRAVKQPSDYRIKRYRDGLLSLEKKGVFYFGAENYRDLIRYGT